MSARSDIITTNINKLYLKNQFTKYQGGFANSNFTWGAFASSQPSQFTSMHRSTGHSITKFTIEHRYIYYIDLPKSIAK